MALSILLAALLVLLVALSVAGCRPTEPEGAVLRAEYPLHLEEHLDDAKLVGSEVPSELPGPVEWRFDEPRPEWRLARLYSPAGYRLPETHRTEDGLRIRLDRSQENDSGRPFAVVYVELPGWRWRDWSVVEIRARTSDDLRNVGVAFNHDEDGVGGVPFGPGPYVPLIDDGTVQSYRLPIEEHRALAGQPWTELAVWFNSDIDEGEVDLISVAVVPLEAEFADAPVGARMVDRRKAIAPEGGAAHRRALYLHAPGSLSYRVEVPDRGRLDVGLGVVSPGEPVNFRVTVAQGAGEREVLLEENHAAADGWAQRSIDLSGFAGRTVDLSLQARARRAGTVALWAAPTLSARRREGSPNIVFYVIDGADADFMGLYGYNRSNTPHLEAIAREGVVFERAYSNSTWSKPSTTSFMTSLHHSVLGGYRSDSDPLPRQAVTMAQHLHRAGYQTAVLASNSYAGRLSGLERGVDVLRDYGTGNSSTSSVSLHEDFWRWRAEYPGGPFWVHFQTTDVHAPNRSVAPFAGLYLSPTRRRAYEQWIERLEEEPDGASPYSEAFERTGIDRRDFFDAARAAYDECMAHQDYQLGRFVERLKSSGEWENTLLIVAADHGHLAGSWHFGVGLTEPLPEPWEIPLASTYHTRIPLVFVWPGGLEGGRRIDEAVSMIDVLPTVLDLAGLPAPEVAQGRSLAPLLRGEGAWEARPVILDEFEVDSETGELRGAIEVIDGRWAASLFVEPDPGSDRVTLKGHHDAVRRKQAMWRQRKTTAPPSSPFSSPSLLPSLLLYDLWRDPRAFHSANAERPDLVEHYRLFLEAQWEAHRALARQFEAGGQVALDPEQLETLRALGYIR